MPTFEAILFDLDGTLADTTEYILGAYNHSLLAAGLPKVTATHIARKGAERLADKYRLFGAKDEQIEGLLNRMSSFSTPTRT